MLQKSLSFRLAGVVVLLLYLALVVAPVLAFLVSAGPGGLSMQTWQDLWRQMIHTKLLASSLLLAGVAAVSALGVGAPIGFVLSRTNVPGRRALALLAALPVLIPPFVWATAWQRLLGAHGSSGFGPAAAVLTLSYYPLATVLSGAAFAHVDPAFEDDLRTIGGEWLVFRYGILPLARPLLVVAFLLVFILVLSEFGVPALMQVNVYPVAVFTAFSAFYDFGRAAVLCLPFAAIAIVLALLARQATRDLDFGSLADTWQARPISLGAARRAVTGLLAAWSVITCLLPAMVLVGQVRGPELVREARGPWLISLGVSLAGATIVSLLGLLVAWLGQRRYLPGGALLLRGQLVLFALPSTVVGLGLVSLWNRAAGVGVYGTPAMIVLGLVARFLPLLVLAWEAFLHQVPPICEEAAWLDGAGGAATFTRVVLPLCGKTLALLWAITVVLCLGELATTILVTPPGVQTLAVRLFTTEVNAPPAQTASVALMLITTCLLPAGAIALVGRGRAPGEGRPAWISAADREGRGN